MIQVETHDVVTVLRLAHGKANALDLELLEALGEQVSRPPAGSRALVLTGSERIFSAGVDLFRIVRDGEDYVRRFLPALDEGFGRLWTCPLPIVAAINGHAIAGGCILAAACDRRLAADVPARIGVTELLVGVPFPPLALETLRTLVAPHVLNDLVLTGRTVPPQEAARLGLVDRVTSEERLLVEAIECARSLAAIPSETFALTKRQLRQPALEEAARSSKRLHAEVERAWTSGDIRAAIEAYVRRLRERSGS